MLYLWLKNQYDGYMFRRDVQDDLEKWLQKPGRKPLILRGARQVGKTTAVNQFAENFENYLYINLEDDLVAGFFDHVRPVDELLVNLFAYCSVRRKEGKTLLFIDEIQNSKKAVASLRYFYEEMPDLYVIAAGSLLESLIDVHVSFPVGRVEYMAVHPCSFREYMVAEGESLLRERISSDVEASVVFHEKLMNMFNRYTLLGGMPEVIKTYTETKDIASLDSIYDALLQGYRDDVEKYARNTTQREVIRYILSAGWAETAKCVTLGGFAGSSYKSREMGEAFRTLEKALLLELVYPTTNTSIPIQSDMRRAPKLIWLDTGLVNYASGIQKEVFMAKDIQDSWRGMVAEQIVAQELLALSNKVSTRRNFWVRAKAGASAEVDFVISGNSGIIPIEVKSGHNAHLRSLHSFVNNSTEYVTAVRVWSQPFSIDKPVTNCGKRFTLINVPFYMVGWLPQIIDRYNEPSIQ